MRPDTVSCIYIPDTVLYIYIPDTVLYVYIPDTVLYIYIPLCNNYWNAVLTNILPYQPTKSVYCLEVGVLFGV